MSTFATRDQENLIQGWETAAAGAKTVGKGGRSLAPKTPGKNFVTPAAPKTNRAPLGAKTTNVKATAFKTPAPLTGGAGLQKTQRRSASGKKPKLKIHQSDATEARPQSKDEADEEPEIEYCPPKVIPLSDEPDAEDILFPENYDFSWAREALRGGYCPNIEVGDDGLTRHEREMKREKEYTDASVEAELYRSLDKTSSSEDYSPEFKEARQKALDREHELDQIYFNGRYAKANTDPEKKTQPKPPPSTLNARSAAQALNQKPLPRFAAPTAAARAKHTAVEKDAPVKKQPPKPRNIAASKATIGYSQGRKVSTNLKQSRNPSGAGIEKSTAQEPKQYSPAKRTALMEQLSLLPGVDEDDEDPIPWAKESDPMENWFEQQMGNFRLSLPDEDERPTPPLEG